MLRRGMRRHCRLHQPPSPAVLARIARAWMSVSISEHDVQVLDRCLDDAIAGTVSEFSRQQQLLQTDQSFELITLVNEAIAAFDALQAGETGGSVAVVHRSLHRIRSRLEKLIRPRPAPVVVE